MSRAQQTSTDQQNGGGAVAPFVAGKNKVINGDFRIWQRGTSFSNPADSTYFADRWLCTRGAVSGTTVVSQGTFTLGSAPVAGYENQYYLNWNQSVAGSDGFRTLNQRIEGVRTFAGQTVTLSYWARLNSGTFTSPAITIRQGFGTGGSPSSIVDTSVTTSFSYGASWVRYTQTFTLPSIAGKTIGTNNNDSLEIIFFLPPASAFNFDIWGVQLEAGSVATPFTTCSNTLQGELALCQRYYVQFGGNASTPPVAAANTTSAYRVPFPVPTSMRTTPSATYSGTPQLYDGVTLININGLGSVFNSYNLVTVDISVASGLTQYRPYVLFFNNGSINFSAEL